MSAFKDITGQRFGRLIVEALHARQVRSTQWLCRCDCGQRKVVSKVRLQTGDTQSCGCLQRETRFRHGYAGPRSPVYDVWNQMVQRCTNPKHRWFKCYGGRGIEVCERWRQFRNFIDDMGPRPEGHSIERVDNDGNYEPGNCKWIPLNEQQKNQRRAYRPKAASTTAGNTTPAQ